MKYLTKVVETYRLPDKAAVETFLQELKADPHFTISKYSSTKKEKKSKGEIIDEWVHFEVTKLFNEERNPDTEIEVEYNYER